MIITILIIAGFQVYWLFQNYAREKKVLSIKTNMDFRETVFELQAGKFKFTTNVKDSSRKDSATINLVISDHSKEAGDQPDIDAVEMINVLGDKERNVFINDTLKKHKVILSLNQSAMWYRNDSSGRHDLPAPLPGETMLRFLSGEDSLHDRLTVKEITQRFGEKIRGDKSDVPFKVIRVDKGIAREKPLPNEVRVGFAKPVAYVLQLGNTFPYLVKKILWPVCFSIFIIALTVGSFILLYRTVLKQQRLVAMKNDFISNVTHELKTPLATVGVAIEALKSFGVVQDVERTNEYLDISVAELQRLSLLVDKVLKVSMLENHFIELKKESFDLRQLVSEVVNIMRLQFEKNNSTVNIQSTGDRFIVEADRLHITSVVYNLLDNALKYSPVNSQIDILISSLPYDVLELKIKDNGIGIAKEYRQKIFEKFFRVPSGDTHNVKGYGLGLSYVREILVAHMGFITVASEPGKGSEFTIIIPYREAPVIQIDAHRKIFRKAFKL
jgi:two-component system phosphate regulon sensor histidine kinase PhoR